MDTILLRFRDSLENIDTIFEHNKIVDQKGYVWWGWWKKEEEPKNLSAINELKTKLSNGSNVTIGLFDRTTSRFFKTDLIAIHSNFRARIEVPEKQKTPKYYRGEKLNCWFKILKIFTIEEEEFISLFSSIPTLNKTLFVLPDESKTEPKDRIEIDSNYILHISDIHFGVDFGFPDSASPNNTPLIDRMKDYFTYNNRIKIGLVIVSGDITSQGDANTFFDTAINFLNNICSFFRIEKNQLLIVPGNHDIPLQKANFIDYRHEKTFKTFLKAFYNEEKEIGGLDKFVTHEGLKFDVLRINSVRLRKVEEKNYGYVGWDDYKRIIEGSTEPDSESIKIAVLHHHLIPVPVEESIEMAVVYGSVSVTVDSGKVIEGLQHYNYHLVLHGHQHIPGINKVYRGIKNGTELDIRNGIILLGAGSAGAKYERLSDRMRDNSFSILRLNSDNISVEAISFNKSKEPETYFKSTLQL